MRKIITFIILFFLTSTFLMSQDIHFSMFYKTPLLLNPANTGNFNGNWRINSTYRKQGDFVLNPFSTNVIAFDIPIYYFKLISSIGFSAVNDRTADNTLSSNIFSIYTAHFIKISSKSYLHMGFGFGFADKSIAPNSLSFPNQFDNSSGIFNPNLDNVEILKNYHDWYLDLSWGLMFTRISEKLKSQIGIAMFHYNKPTLDFSSISHLSPKYQLHGYFEKTITKNLFIKPKFLFSYENNARELLVGNEFGLNFNNISFKTIYLGAFFRGGFVRNPDAFIINLGFDIKNFNINFSYDYSFISTNYAKDLTFEIAVLYILPHLQIDKRAIQCDIF